MGNRSYFLYTLHLLGDMYRPVRLYEPLATALACRIVARPVLVATSALENVAAVPSVVARLAIGDAIRNR